MQTIFGLELSLQQRIAITNSFQIDSDQLRSSAQHVLHNRNFRTKVSDNGIDFISPVHFTTHSGADEFAGMNIFRKGRIELLELPNQKIEIKGTSSLEYLIFFAAGVSLTVLLVFLFFPQNEFSFKLIPASLLLMVLIIGIGRKSIKNRIAEILEDIVKNKT